MKQLKVLIACEESQAVCKAFRELGHNAFSCDIQDCSGGHPEWHIKKDVISLITCKTRFVTMDNNFHNAEKWDLIIAHPPCTYLSNAGARWLYKDGKLNTYRLTLGLYAKAFFMKILESDCDHICIENPMPSKIFHLPKQSQIIQPYQFGHPYSKKTYLWLKNLPPLIPTDIVDNYKPFVTSGSYSKSHNPKYKGCCRKGGAAKSRSKTFTGIAKAMAEQWSKYIIEDMYPVVIKNIREGKR